MTSSTSLSFDVWNWSIFAGKFTLVLSTAFGIFLYTCQDYLLYHPAPPNFSRIPDGNQGDFKSPGQWSISGIPMRRYRDQSKTKSIPFEDNMIETIDGIRIHTWLLLQEDSNNVPTIVYWHGNAGNMGFRLKNAAEMYSYIGVNILMVDYRGYGKSEGSPTEEGLKADAESVLRYIKGHPKLTNSSIILFGRSLGGAVSIALAYKFPDYINGIILENTFLSISAMVDVLLPYVKWFKHLILRIKWNSDEKIKQLKQPIMFISGGMDNLVPPKHSRILYNLAALSSHKDFFYVSDGSHNDTWEKAAMKNGHDNYYQRIKKFISTIANMDKLNIEPLDESKNVVEIDPQMSIPTMNKIFKIE